MLAEPVVSNQGRGWNTCTQAGQQKRMPVAPVSRTDWCFVRCTEHVSYHHMQCSTLQAWSGLLDARPPVVSGARGMGLRAAYESIQY